jgi:hypothetical protein
MDMKSIRYELKYCEGCGTLKLRDVTSVTNYCRVCEEILARFRFPIHARVKSPSRLMQAAIENAAARPVGVAAGSGGAQ